MLSLIRLYYTYLKYPIPEIEQMTKKISYKIPIKPRYLDIIFYVMLLMCKICEM